NANWATFFVASGLACLLFHAASDNDLQVRRTYGMVGFVCLGAALLITILPLRNEPAGKQFLPWGFLGLVLGFLFLLPFVRNEDDPKWCSATIRVLGGVGAVLALIGFIGGNVSTDFFLSYGLLLALLGLPYLWAFVGFQGTSTDYGYKA